MSRLASLAIALTLFFVGCQNAILKWATSDLSFAGVESFVAEPDSVTLRWNLASGAQAYVAFEVTGSVATTLGRVGAALSAFTVTGLTPGSTYRFRVRLIDGAGNPDTNTNDVEVTTPTSASTAILPAASSLRLWLKSTNGITKDSGNLVGQWADQSGNGNGYSTEMSAEAPLWQNGVLNGLPAIQFDGIDDTMTGSMIFAQNPHTVLVAFVRYAPSPQALISEIVSNGLIYGMGSTTKLGISKQGVAMQESDLATAPNVPHVATYISDGDVGSSITASFWLNSVAAQATLTQSTVSYGSGSRIGSANGGNSLHGQLAEVLVYDIQLSPAERQQAEDYLKQRYGIGS